jgi:hexosaminidase
MVLSIIPKPVSIKYTDGVFNCKVETQKGMPPIIKKEVNPKEQFGQQNREAYKLTILKENITLEAASPAGMFNGEQTVRQLVLSELKDSILTLPCAEITDYPRFSWRGFMLDCSRYFYSIPFIKKILDALSLHHINRFHWHLTDDQGWRLPVDAYPLLTEIGSRRQDRRYPWVNYKNEFYSKEEIKKIVDYAKKLNIEVIPEVDLPGHASAILASYPGLGCTGGPYRVEDRFGIF